MTNQPTPKIRVPVPTTTFLPETVTSHAVIIEPYHVDLLEEYGYISREYLLSGIASGESYCTRILLRCPAVISNFTGLVILEPSHLWGGTSIWRHINRWLMRNGHAWLEVDSQAPSALGKIKRVNPTRYKDLHFIPGPLADEFQESIPYAAVTTKESLRIAYDSFKAKWWPATIQCPEIIVQASYALRAGDLGLKATRVILTGLSQTGGLTRRFITHSSHLRLPNGNLPFEAFVPCQSGGEALPDIPGAKIMELLGESEFLSVRALCGVGGQMKDISHRRSDSDGFRLYEVAGMGHRESRYASEVDLARWSVAKLHGAKWSTFANSFIYHAIFERMEKWISESAISPPPSAIIQTIALSDEIFRDEHGNAAGGVRTVHTEAPLSRIVAATPKGRPSWYCGSEWPFDNDKLRNLYGSVVNFRRMAGQAISDQLRSGFLLQADAETLRRETIENVHF
ncbi:signal peptide-containing protein [Colletotrichum truncatum]|uniref:Signal peptide-containing protein n=1 Tax=Colletotrichum truncatum TaxID=5467 RepID=A0ACC3Z6W8_COLTU|nr:signal peptide-containing protein [Colletotrichum truncatum]KAF6781272.1 signal peptide-containing protein [Colletotrichum truncatum]